MKYGKTERISGIVILLALLAIFVPWLMSDPAPREERPQPTFVIERPVEATQQDVPAPQMPSSINTSSSEGRSVDSAVNSVPIDANPRQPQTGQASSSNAQSAGANDPIAELMAANNRDNASTSSSASSSSTSSNAAGPTSSSQGEWAVQVGSFGNADNAQRLSDQLTQAGFSAYLRERDNNLTSVYVGPYATSEDGESAMAIIKQRANVQGLLVRVRN
ncbi:SPOR domain-containing protein [Vreelandella sp. 21]|uniref:SPOR domain-containing protein n=1 Tax=Vreelandella alkaliphila TaxID=272774 RepID=A0AAJ2S497_9GAMM|nr:SPOR domain-containing protein [Halomonas alkaliphila]AIA75918.1 acetyl-CoA carboxylase [Halomonas campaniensis]MDX5979478.1 SPOR domain-containing protein [Halomonas alkaliphila]